MPESKFTKFCHFWNNKKGAYQSKYSVKFQVRNQKSEILHFDGGFFCPDDITFQLRKYRRVASHDIEEWCKV